MLNATHVPALSCRGRQTGGKAARTERPPVLMTAGTPAAHFLVQPRAREDARRFGTRGEVCGRAARVRGGGRRRAAEEKTVATPKAVMSLGGLRALRQRSAR